MGFKRARSFGSSFRLLCCALSKRKIMGLASCVVVCLCFLTACIPSGFAQSINSGTITGTVTDPSGASVAGASVEISNALTGYQQTTVADTNGLYRFTNIPFNGYHLTASHSGFSNAVQNVEVRSTVPVAINLALPLAGTTTSVTVEATESVIETEPSAHSDVDMSTLERLPITMAGSGLSEAVTMMAPGVVNDSNGFFHPVGDHASYSMQLDGQPINDQFSKNFSTQIPVEALQSVELTTGFPGAQYGEKTSLVMNTTTRSGLGLSKPTGSLSASYGSYGTTEETVTFGLGSQKFGNFLVASGARSGRFLDTAEFVPLHAIGNNGSFFDRIDYQPDVKDVFHLNLFTARNWFQIPNQYDQQAAGQDQRQKVFSYNIAPGYQHTFSSSTLLTLNAWVRQDQVHYYPSADVFSDSPATLSQQRRLMSVGAKGDLAYIRGKHNMRFGTQFLQTRLKEAFQLGVTDPAFNPVCFHDAALTAPVTDQPTITDPANCAASTFFPNTTDNGFLQGLVPFDLTRNGTLFRFNGKGNINEYAFYATDTITWGRLTLTPGLRITYYDGLAQATGVQPRVGAAYLIKRTGTVLRASYARSLETPGNENLLLSSSTGSVGGLTNVFGAVGQAPVPPSRRNQFNVGFQQTFGRWVQVDADYYWKFAHPGFEWDVIFNTPITFPIAWKQDKLDGFGIRVSTLDIRGFKLNTTMGYGRLRYFGPEIGGLLFNSPVANVFRTDSDDPFYQTTVARYQFKHNGPWFAFTWRYDFGEVAGGAAADLGSILGLTGDQQHQMGFFCGTAVATPTNPITTCNLPFGQWGATRVQVPAPGTANDDHNPQRVATRNIFDIGVGTDNLFRSADSKRVTLQFTVVNISNQDKMYNFLSTFGGTHFIQPRSYEAKVGFVF
jgi:Carboxypeptidase regulatory-like domain